MKLNAKSELDILYSYYSLFSIDNYYLLIRLIFQLFHLQEHFSHFHTATQTIFSTICSAQQRTRSHLPNILLNGK